MLKIVAIALICAVIIIYLKSINSELSLLATVGAGIIILFLSLEYVINTLDFFNSIVELTGIDKSLYAIIFKITAIGYIIEFSADTVLDFGLKSLADKLIFAGKLIILVVSLPVFYAIINLLLSLIK